MAEQRLCKHCHKHFITRAQNPNQQYCSAPTCQKARKGEWQKQKIKTDSDYRANQQDAQRRWREKHPNYWREYRNRHPEYLERNRQQQRERNRQRQRQSPGVIAKMDSSTNEKSVNSGCYELRRIGKSDNGIAKMDVSIVEINVISGSCFPRGGDCKERTCGF